MINVNFDYKGHLVAIQCNGQDKLLKICSKFALRINEPVESKIFVWNNQLLNLDKTFTEQMNDSLEKKEEIKIIVNDIAKNDTVLIKYNFNGVDEEFKAKKEDNIFELIQALIKKPIDILFGGKRATKTDFQKNFNQLANSIDKEENQMNLLVIERESIKSENNEPKNEQEKNKSDIEENLIINEEKQDEENDDDNEEEKEELKSKKDNKKNDVKKGNSNGDFFETMVGNFDQNAITDTMKIFEDNKTYKVKNIKVFLLKFFSLLLLELVIIGSLVFLGGYFKFNELLYEKRSNTLGVFIPSLLLIFILYFCQYFCFLKEKDGKTKLKLFIIFFYIISISLLLILLSEYCSYEYIIYTLSLTGIDLLFYIIFYSICYTKKGIISFVISLVINIGILLLIFFYIFEKNKISELIIIGTISLILNFNISINRYNAKIKYNDNQYLNLLLIYNFDFWPFIILPIFMTLFVSIYIAFLVIIYIFYIIMLVLQILCS